GRGRHTRFSRDWSSDVCSSDLSATRNCKASAICLEVGRQAGFSKQIAEALQLRVAERPCHAHALVQREGRVFLGKLLPAADEAERDLLGAVEEPRPASEPDQVTLMLPAVAALPRAAVQQDKE